MIFSGTFEHTLDAKHRLTLPADFREVLVGKVVLALSPETEPGARCLEIWTQDGFAEHAATMLAGTNPRSPQARKLKRMLHSTSWPTDIDSANRVMVPALALSWAKLDTKVTLAGAGDCLEVWERDAWTAYFDGLLAGYSDLLANIDNPA